MKLFPFLLCLLAATVAQVFGAESECETNAKQQAGADLVNDKTAAAEGMALELLKGDRKNGLAAIVDTYLDTGKMGETDAMTEYGKNLAFAGIPVAGLGFFVITILVWLFLPIFRCCRCCCCKPKADKNEYSFYQMTAPHVFWFLFAFLVILFSIVGVVAISGMGTSAISTIGLLDKTFSDSTTFIEQIEGLVIPLGKNMTKVIDDVELTLAGSTALGSDLTDIGNQIAAMINNASQLTFNISGTVVPSPISSARANEITSAMQTALSATVTNLDTEMGKIKDTLLIPKVMITLALNVSQTAIDMVKVMLADARNGIFNKPLVLMKVPMLLNKDEYTGIGDLMCDLKKGLLLFGSIFFAGAIVGVVVQLPAWFLGKLKNIKACSACSHFGLLVSRFGCCLLLTWMILLFLLSGLLLPIGLVFSDVCDIVELVPDNIGRYTSQLGMAPVNASANGTNYIKIAQGCMSKPAIPLMQNIDLTEALKFTDELDLAQVMDAGLASKLSSGFAEFDTEANTILALNYTSFGITDDALTKYTSASTGCQGFVAAQAAATAQFATAWSTDESNAATACDNCDLGTSACTVQSGPCPTVTACVGLQSAFTTIMNSVEQAKTDIATQLGSLQTLVQTTVNNKDAFVATGTQFEQNLINSATPIAPLILEAKALQNLGDCSFMRTTFDDFHGELCGPMLSKWLTTGMMMLIVGLLGYPVIITTVIIHNRHFLATAEEHFEDPLEVEMGKTPMASVAPSFDKTDNPMM